MTKRVLLILVALVLAAGVAVSVFLGRVYPAGEVAQQVQASREQTWYALPAENSDVGFIFYPGAMVDTAAYLPLMAELQQQGVNCYLVEMPLHLAFLGANQASDVMTAHPEITHWYMGGHSLGGAFASNFAAGHKNQVKGVVLLGAYLYGDYPVSQSLTIYGSEDQVLNRSKVNYTENVHELEGGNHAWFGDYGSQKGDGTASLTHEAQWQQTAELLISFMQQQ